MDDIFEKIFSIIDIDKINSKKEFDDFIFYLTNQPTPLREAVSNKLEDIYQDEYIDENNIKIISDAIVDINPNISRNICSIINKSKHLQQMILPVLIEKINFLLGKISDNVKSQNNKSHAKNKILFSLYWLLEGMSYCVDSKYEAEILKILHSTIKFKDYTIREKTALILSKINVSDNELIERVKNDSNFYVNFYTKLLKK